MPDEHTQEEQKGGSPTDNSLYMLISSILLLTSCLSFCIATVLFINACINLHKAQNGFMKDENTEPIIEQPIIEYLKPNNFLYIDKFFLDMKESKSPVVITLGIIIAISITVLGALIAYWSQNKPNTLIEWRKSLTTSSFLKYIPILYIIIIGLVFNNSIITANKDTLNTFEKEFDKLIINFDFKGEEPTLKETFLKELKKIIISEIYNNYKNDKFEYNEKIITDKLLTNVNIIITTKITDEKLTKIFGSSTTTIYTISKVIFYIYKLSYYKKKEDDENIIDYDKRIKDDIQEYINRIDRYFNILANDTKGTNYYNKFYLISLIKKDSSVDNDIFDITIKDRVSHVTGINALKNLNFNDKIESIKNRIQTYYITIIVLYIILLICLLIYYFKDFHNLCIFIYNLLFIYNISILRAFISILIIVIILAVLFTMRNYKI